MTQESPFSEERETRAPWHEAPTPFMAQSRAQSALRHELDAIATELKPSVESRKASDPEGTFELLVLPNRVVARLHDVAISFSWLSGRTPSVADGCLMVIAWSNVASGVRGVAALKSATMAQERTYIAAGASPDDWRWRADGENAESCSTALLAAEWVAKVGRAA